MFVMEPRKDIGVAAAFCLVARILWLYDALAVFYDPRTPAQRSSKANSSSATGGTATR
jgi:hypothetical protein